MAPAEAHEGRDADLREDPRGQGHHSHRHRRHDHRHGQGSHQPQGGHPQDPPEPELQRQAVGG